MVSYDHRPDQSSLDDCILQDAPPPPTESASFEEEKRAVYKHPLFPLLALVFERCEQATHYVTDPSPEGFLTDVRDFVHHQERDNKPLFTGNAEVDNLMIKAIQVLRIHLLELEKVQELCRDFCTRYITCLKGKMQSENLLRTDYDKVHGGVGVASTADNASAGARLTVARDGNISSDSGSSSSASVPYSPESASASSSSLQRALPRNLCAMNRGGNGELLSKEASGVLLLMSNNSHSYPPPPSLPHSHFHLLNTPPTTSASFVAALSERNVAANSATSASDSCDSYSPASVLSWEDTHENSVASSAAGSVAAANGKKQKVKRGVLPKQATSVMRSWLFKHLTHPYPTEEEKKQIAVQTNLTLLQVNNWFINARRRILQPMIENNASNNISNNNKKVELVNTAEFDDSETDESNDEVDKRK